MTHPAIILRATSLNERTWWETVGTEICVQCVQRASPFPLVDGQKTTEQELLTVFANVSLEANPPDVNTVEKPSEGSNM